MNYRRDRGFFLKCYLVKHVVGYSLSVCEFVSFSEKQSDVSVSEVAVSQGGCLF